MTAVIILEYNNSRDTINCIESVLTHNTAPVKFIVVDNGSTNRAVVAELEDYFADKFSGNWEKIEERDTPKMPLQNLTFFLSQTNDGYAKGNNKGLLLADMDNEIDSILILNSDILFVEDILPGLLHSLDLKDAAIISPVLFKKDMDGLDGNCARRSISVSEAVWMNCPFPYDVFKISKRRKLKIGPNAGLMPIDLPSGSCMLMRKDVFRNLGWFDPGTFLYFEEDILFEKTKRLGLRNYIDTGARCIHLGATTTKSTSSRFIVQCNFASARYFIENFKNASKFNLALLNLFSHLTMLKIRIKEFFHK